MFVIVKVTSNQADLIAHLAVGTSIPRRFSSRRMASGIARQAQCFACPTRQSTR
jgi:hypothetical protein